jgi:phosphatidylglycerol:prolipoprotein diacylglycerol transferase
VFEHRLDPIIGTVAGAHLWWYGLSYALGFWNLHWYLRRRREQLKLCLRDVYSLTLCLSIGVLAGGRVVEVAFDEWLFYRQHPRLIPALWLGGMATHGLLLGAAVGLTIFARFWHKPFLQLADALVIPGTFLMGIGRIGNFIDGQIVGSVTEVPWGVQFPDAEGIRHPVVLYDGAKNLLLIPYLLWVRQTNPKPGAMAARFVFWYAFPRLFIDLFRDYPTHRLALGTGQTLNIVMAIVGTALIIRSRRRSPVPLPETRPTLADVKPALWQPLALAALLAFCLLIASNWTQDVPARYGKRHQGLSHSWLYPTIDTAPHGEMSRASCTAGWLAGGKRLSPVLVVPRCQ